MAESGAGRLRLHHGEQTKRDAHIGVTSDLARRAKEHRDGVISGFTRRYECKQLVWYEVHDSIEAARRRELQMKEWKRREIEGFNPEWEDVFGQVALP